MAKKITEKYKKNTFKYSKADKKKFLFVYLLIAFPVAQFALFWVYINFSAITLSFKDLSGVWTLNNFEAVIRAFSGTDHYGFNLKDALFRSLTLWAFVNVIVFSISLITTYVLFKKIPGHYFFRVCFMLPGLVGAVIWVSIIKQLAAYDGPIVSLLTNIGVPVPDSVIRQGLLGTAQTSFKTILFVAGLGIAGGSVILTGAYTRIPKEIFESANIDGAGFWREMFNIALPCIWPTVSTLIIFSVCSIFTADSNVYLYSNGTGEPEMSTIGYYLYYLNVRVAEAGVGQKMYNYPSAVGLVITIFTIPIVIIVRRLFNKIDKVEF